MFSIAIQRNSKVDKPKQLLQIAMEEVNLNRVKIAFQSVGSEVSSTSERKAPIILLHGVTNSKETWKTILHPLAFETGRKVYAFDARNHGDSGWSDELSYEIMQEDLLMFMDSLHVERAILIGHSMGGKVAMYFALQWPDRVEKLIVEDISPKPAAPGIRSRAAEYVQLLHYVLEIIPKDVNDLTAAKKFVHKFFKEMASTEIEEGSSEESNDDGATLPLAQDENGKFRWKANLKAIEEFFIKRTNSSMIVNGTYPDPALLIWGTKSPYKVTADREFILEHFPNARFRAIEGAAHSIHQYFEEVFLKEVVHFINEAR